MGFPALTHAKAILNENRTSLVGGFSPDVTERDAFSKAYQVPSYSSVDELLDRETPDLVSICSPSEFHFAQVMQCIETAVPMVWLEKPPVLSLSELDGLIDAADRYGNNTRILVNFQRRYQDSYNELKRIYQNGEFGDCRGITLTYSRGLETNGSHMLDILFHITAATGSNILQWVEKSERESPNFSLMLSGGLPVMVQGMELPYHCIDISLTFEHGRASVIHGGMKIELEQKIEHEFFPGFHRLQYLPDVLLAEDDLLQGMQRALSDLIDSSEQQREPFSNLKSAQKTQSLMEEVRFQQGCRQ